MASYLGGEVHSLGHEVRVHLEPVPMRHPGKPVLGIQGQTPQSAAGGAGKRGLCKCRSWRVRKELQ